MSDIKAPDSRIKVFTDGGVKFTIPGLTKTRRSGPPNDVFFVEFKECECLCPVKTVKVYLDKTDPLRDGNSQLVILHRRPHSPVSSATISRWIMDPLVDRKVRTVYQTGVSLITGLDWTGILKYFFMHCGM